METAVAVVSVAKMERACEDVCVILKALSHPQRLMVMGHLLQGAKTVSELVELCGISQSQMSQFLMRMGMEGLVASEKRGKFRVYSVADKRLINLMRAIQDQYCRR